MAKYTRYNIYHFSHVLVYSSVTIQWIFTIHLRTFSHRHKLKLCPLLTITPYPLLFPGLKVWFLLRYVLIFDHFSSWGLLLYKSLQTLHPCDGLPQRGPGALWLSYFLSETSRPRVRKAFGRQQPLPSEWALLQISPSLGHVHFSLIAATSPWCGPTILSHQLYVRQRKLQWEKETA